jgi:HAE1 family hydrophobic/amphiphilic exporter-1
MMAILLAAFSAASASAEPLTRAEAVARALKANPDVLRSIEDMALLQARSREALADALPELNILGNASRYRDPGLLNSSSFDAFPPELRDSLRPIPANLFEGVAQLKQTIFSFKLRRAIKAARLAQDLGRENVRVTQQSIALDAIRAYNTLLLGLERVRVVENTVRQKEKHLEMARNRRQAGVATELDVLRAQVDLENQRTQLLRVRGQVESDRSTLNAVMVRPVDAPVEPVDTLAFAPLDTTLETTVREALAARPEMKVVSLNERIRDELIGVAKAEGRPHLEFLGNWGYSVRRPANFFESSFAKWNAGVTLTVPVFDGFRTAGKVAQARAERGKVAQDRTALENRIRLQARDAVNALDVAKSVLEGAELNVSQARRALEMTQANYAQGAATTLDVTDSQAALTLAEILRAEALYDHANARATLRYVTGRDPLEPSAGPPAAAR